MATRLYFHAASSSVGGTLPSTEQSSLTATWNADAQTVNRSMDTTAGTSETSLSLAHGTGNAYFTKFVSAPLDQTSIAANTWTFGFAAMEDDTGNNFPVSSTNKSVRIHAYVWRPSNGTKVGTILDGVSAATVDEGAAAAKIYHVVTFTGSAVNNVQTGDVIIFEWWNVFADGSGPSGNNTYYYDGTTVYAENATATSSASYIETPETLTFYVPVVTRLYFHAATSNVSGTLPSTEQSTAHLSSGDYESQSTNRSMNTTIGTSQASLSFTSTQFYNGNQQFYVTKFISPPLDQSGVAANTWKLNFSIKASATSMLEDYPTYDNNPQRVPVTIYVWRPSTGQKVGNILDGDTNSGTYYDVGIWGGGPGFEHPTTNQVAEDGTFSGSAVAGAQAGDVIVLEMWVIIYTNSTNSVTLSYYYDGTTENTTSGAVVSNHASFLETPEELVFQAGNNIIRTLSETVSKSESIAVLRNKIRTKTETLTTSEASFTRLLTKQRSMTTQTVTVSEPNPPSWVKARNISKTLSDTINIGAETLAKLKSIFRTKSETTTVSTVSLIRLLSKFRTKTETTNVSTGTSVRLKGAIKTLSESNINLSDSIVRLLGKFRVFTETTSLSESVDQQKTTGQNNVIKTITEDAISISSTIEKSLSKIRTLSQSISLSEGIERLLIKSRVLATETITTSDSIARARGIIKTLTETTINISTSLNRLLTKIRTVTESAIDISDSRIRLVDKLRQITETVNLTEDLDKFITYAEREVVVISDEVTRTVSHVSGITREIIESNISITDSITKLKSIFRTSTDTVTKSETLTRSLAKIRTITQTVSESEQSIIRLLTRVRASTDTITKSESIQRLLSKYRTSTDTLTTTETRARVKGILRGISDQSYSISDSLNRLKMMLRAASDTLTIIGILDRLLTKVRSKSESNINISDAIEILVTHEFIKNVVRIIEESLIIVSDFFYKARTLVESPISLGDLVARVPTNNSPINYEKTLTESATIGAGVLIRISTKLKPLNENVSQSDQLVLTRRTKVRTKLEINDISDTVTIYHPIKNITKSLSDSINAGEGFGKVAGKVRRIGGPG